LIRCLFVNHHIRTAQVWHVFSRDLTVLPAHPHAHPQSETAIPAFAFSAIAGTHLPTPEGRKAELTWVDGYVVRQFTCPKAITHPTTNRRNRAQYRPTRYRYTKPPVRITLVDRRHTRCDYVTLR